MSNLLPFRISVERAIAEHRRPWEPPAEVVSLNARRLSEDARRISRALAHQAELEEIALDYGPKEF